MSSEDKLKCVACYHDHTMKQILIECGDFVEVRQRYCNAENVRHMFQEISGTEEFDVLWERVLTLYLASAK